MSEPPARRRDSARSWPRQDSNETARGYASVFAKSPFATAVTEGERHVLRYMNAAWLELAGADDSALGQPFAEKFPELMALDPDLLDRVCRTQQAAHSTDSSNPQDHLYVTIVAWPWAASSAGPQAIIVQLTDVTRQTLERGRSDKLTREMRDINEQLLLSGVREHDLATRRAQLLVGAEEASRAKSTFISTISHELRTPLNALLGYEELLREGLAGPVTDKQKHMLGRVRESALHLLALVEQILTFSRTEAGRMTVVPERCEVTSLARETGIMIDPLVHKKHLSFRMVLPDQPIEMETDPGLLKQILINLLNNAVKFTDTGEIRLEIQPVADDVVCAVHDTGIGIAAEDLEHIFEPFQQVEPDRAHQKEGTGLGLTVSRRLARLLGGDVTVQSKPGEGSTFTVRIPRRATRRTT